jgi:hypothetical protein
VPEKTLPPLRGAVKQHAAFGWSQPSETKETNSAPKGCNKRLCHPSGVRTISLPGPVVCAPLRPPATIAPTLRVEDGFVVAKFQ